ncbi:MAG: hypothetical protein K2L42_03495 [Clostridia bacterium]|nr:hypothetical protein [Clostridia bacterium]
MKSKRLIRFYFSADELNRALDNLITVNALKIDDFSKGAEYCAERILKLIQVKREFCALWRYIDGIMEGLSAEERGILRFYGTARCGIKSIGKERAKEVKRVTVKFGRRARRLERYAEAVRLLGEYYCLCNAGYNGFFLEDM